MKNKISKERINKLVRASVLNEKEVLKEIQKEEKRTVAKITDQDIYNNLESWYKASTRTNRKDGKNWYKDAQTFCKDISKKYKVDPYIVASVVSALSPNNKWERNKIDAEALIGCYTSGKFTEKEIMKDVARIEAEGEGFWFISLFGERKFIEGTIQTVDLMDTHSVLITKGNSN